MREILFRGKSTGGIDKWIEGTGVFNDGINTWISFNEPNSAIAYGIKHHIVLPETVGQYTGLTDKNGGRIFEGDIVEYKEGNGEIVYHDQEAMFVVCFDTWLTDFDHLYGKDIEIVGNIHDNPELLKGGEE